MEIDVARLGLGELQVLYNQESARLYRQLVAGTDWEQTAEQREHLGALHREIYRRMNPEQFTDPAGTYTRRDLVQSTGTT